MIKVNDRVEFLNEVFRYIPANPSCVELGVLRGEFSEMIKDRLSPSYLILIDPFITNFSFYKDGNRTAYSTNEDYKIVYDKFIGDRTVTIITDYSYNVVTTIKNLFFNFIYIDACHLYQDVKIDLNDWLPQLKDNGLMCGHDYGGIFEGVKQAVDEFMIEHNFEMIILNEQGGDFALRRCIV